MAQEKELPPNSLWGIDGACERKRKRTLSTCRRGKTAGDRDAGKSDARGRAALRDQPSVSLSRW